MRQINCPDCGKITPTHPEDAARGLFTRYTKGKALNSALCDLCGKELPAGSDVVARSIPDTMGRWEDLYLYTDNN